MKRNQTKRLRKRLRKWKSQRRAKLESLEPRQLLAADVYISEFMASNDGVVLDEDGDDSDWIEIFNAGPDDVNLDGWHLTDDPAQLSKWDFPDQSLSAGNSLVVFASDKDRGGPGEELHLNFKLSAGGEYLALTRNTSAGGFDIVSEFAPEFPQQTTDISYGYEQEVSVDTIVEPGAPARLLIPTSEPSSSWTNLGFNDSSWQNATSAIGYQTSVPGFTVQDAKSSGRIVNISESLRLLDGTGQQSSTTAISPVINFFDTGSPGRYSSDLPFPNNTSGDDNDFAIRATGTITIPQSGTWTFGTNSDDGARLRVDGRTVINDDTLHAPEDRFGTTTLSAGQHEIELIFFERGGGAEVELFAAQGSRSSFDSSAFRLIGDVANGGLEVTTSPTEGSSGLSSVIETNVEAMRENASSAYLRVPFTVTDPASYDSLTLEVSYDDGFIAYLNGTEVARRNAPASASFNSTALDDRPFRNAVTPEFVGITDHLDLLRSGDNVLAIHGLNDSSDSDEFLLRVGLSEISTTRGDAVFFREVTAGTFNPSEGAEDFLLDDVTLSHPHGFYENAIQLELDSRTAGTSIRYTTDGSEPTSTNGQLYNNAIAISETTTIRARSFKQGSEPSRIETATYLFLDDVLTQSPNGQSPENWPTAQSINGQQLDYGLDPDIVNSSIWRSQMEEALTQIPSMSLVLDIDDLLGSSEGIYTNAQSHGRDWERPASLELINPDGSEGFQVEAGVRVRGGFSRSDSNPKHAFRLFFRDEYGDAKLEYPLFGDEGVDEFDKIDLRTSQNYSWAFRGSTENTFVRDVYSRDVQGLLGNPYTRSSFYHLYINGQYWGLYQTQERAEARYAASYFGGDKDDYDVVKSAGSSGGYETEATDGNLDALRRLADYFYQNDGLSDANMADYWMAQGMNPDGSENPGFERLLDVENLIDYMIITYFTSDADGPGSKFTRPRVNNYFGILNRENPDGFKWFEHDSEHSLDTGDAAGANFNMVTPLTTGGSQFRYFNPHWMHEQLAQTNSVYREQFADRVYETMFNDGLLTAEKSNEIIDARAAQIDMAIIAESARWGDAQRTTPYTKTHWEDAVQRTKDWIDDRVPVVIQQLQGIGWFPDTLPPEFTVNDVPQHGGELTASDEIGFSTTANIEFDTVLRRNASWNFLDDGSNQGTAWRNNNFDDSDWDSGRGQLGYGDGDENTVLSYGSNGSDKHRTTYFRNSFDISDVEQYDLGRIQLLRDDGAIVYLNGEEIARSNMPSGTVNFRTFANQVAGGTDESTYYPFEFPAGLLQEGENFLAVEIHQANASSSDISFDLQVELGIRATGVTNIYYTLDGSDPRTATGGISATAIRFDGQSPAIGGETELSVRIRETDGTWSVLNRATFLSDGTAQPPVIPPEQSELVGLVRSGRIVLQASDLDVQGINFESEAGLLVPIPNNDASPFDIALSNTNTQISLGNLGSTVRLDGELITEIRYEGTDPSSDLKATYGVEGVEVAFPVEVDATPTHDCNGDGVTDAADLNCVCQSGAVDELLAELGIGRADLNADGTVGFADFLILSASFGQSDVGYANGDMDCSGTVDFADFLVLSSNFGT